MNDIILIRKEYSFLNNTSDILLDVTFSEFSSEEEYLYCLQKIVDIKETIETYREVRLFNGIAFNYHANDNIEIRDTRKNARQLWYAIKSMGFFKINLYIL